MRTHGTLTKWIDDRGYGFVALPRRHEKTGHEETAHEEKGREEIFVHISAFPRSGSRPCIGEMISFEVHIGADGRKRAVAVVRPGAPAPLRERRNTSSRRGRGLFGTALAMGAAGILCVGGYLVATSNQSHSGAFGITELGSGPLASPTETWRCDGRTHCSQMGSCAEARYFLKNCPGMQVDGDNDGQPCEQQCN